MSTRSGKRIHSSFHEKTLEPELLLRSERKARSKRSRDGEDHLDLDAGVMRMSKLKKRNNYVSYPASEQTRLDAVVKDNTIPESKIPRKLLKNTLKEHNNIGTVQATDTLETNVTRITRRTKKFAGDAVDMEINTEINEAPFTDIPNRMLKVKRNRKIPAINNTEPVDENIENVDVDIVAVLKKSKKKKKGKRSNSIAIDEIQPDKDIIDEVQPDEAIIVKNEKGKREALKKLKKRKKKKGKHSNSIVVEEIQPDVINNVLNKSNVSTDSFHSAAGSPVLDNCEIITEKDLFIKIPSGTEVLELLNSTIDKKVFKEEDLCPVLKKSFEKKGCKKRKSIIKDADFGKDAESVLLSSISNNLHSTFDKIDDSAGSVLNTTFEKEPTMINKSLLSNSSTENTPGNILNGTFEKTHYEKTSKVNSLNSTYEKETETKLTSTFDKTESQKTSAKFSFTSSDGAINVTFDKSDNSRTSITDDDSKTDNIINTTPVLIESSLDESQMSTNGSKHSTSFNATKHSTSFMPTESKAPPTPLKRESTFTKDGPDVIIMSPKPKLSTEKTPTKRISLPSPGYTPFPILSSTRKNKSVLNVTRSIEKPGRTSLVAEASTRQTRVMFCSPINNTAVMQQKRKIIKSSLKGSNKSFVFDESVTNSSRPTAGRKRSYTQSDADDAGVKRKRLAGDIQQSVDRLSRPRTSSAAAKLPDPMTPSKKLTTPAKTRSESKVSRTKLPNFAALHQRRFQKMESLDECQERKAKRARQLLTPTGSVNVVERSSPRLSLVELNSTKETVAKKPEILTKTPKQSTLLDTLNPGYTRFGFKMHTDGNPFSFPSKTDTKPKEKQLNGLIKVPLPSLAGTTSRREVAKQVVMREKSFTSCSGKREVKRKENRTIIKGVRTNRRFDLQMKMRNIDG